MASLFSSTQRETLTVSALNRAVAGLLARGMPLVNVSGEIGNLARAASGHWYFTLKDDAAQVRCVMFRGRNALLGFVPREGDAVQLRASVGLYEARGEYQLTVESMERAGQGRLFEEFMRLKARLAAEGLFDDERKRPLPALPRAIGIVTSLQAAALRDVVTTLQRRAPYARLIVYPVPVQGEGAGARIAAMLATAGARREVEVLLLVRGGGSIEDLWAFNEEVVARAIRASALPVVVGVGHESDITIADFAADLRAPTPTAARRNCGGACAGCAARHRCVLGTAPAALCAAGAAGIAAAPGLRPAHPAAPACAAGGPAGARRAPAHAPAQRGAAAARAERGGDTMRASHGWRGCSPLAANPLRGWWRCAPASALPCSAGRPSGRCACSARCKAWRTWIRTRFCSGATRW
ncbi:MAG: exodeoxyribonuclease VII large subunit [Burkholderiaceae bacterium]|nr:exodeoxyribonuclease VII large subunit [Burkholderiaceae bacterium]